MIKSSSEVGRFLHQEHLDTLAAMNALEAMIDSKFRDRPPDVSREAVRQQLDTLITAVDHDLYHHFQFEERDLFPILDLAGLGEMTAMLIHEHDAIRRLADRLRSVAVRALQDAFDKTTWREFREAGMDLVPSVMFHIQKEEMGFIQRLDVFLDAATDKKLVDLHAEQAS
jgi:DUF438 domain-containing protein